MKKLFWLILPAALFVASCDKTFKVGAPYKEVTAVYCLLAKSDTAHYVKVMKGFYDEEMDNLLIAQNPDSIFFKDLEVKFEELNNGSVLTSYLLNKVNLADEGYVKDNGVFAINPNYAYKFKAALNPSHTYRLQVRNKQSGKVVYAETSVISDQLLKIEYPTPNNDRLNFSDYSQNYNFIFTAPTEAAICDIQVRLYYTEKDVMKPDSLSKKVIDLTLLKNVENTGGRLVAPFRKEEFFRILNSELGTPGPNVVRYIDTPDVLFVAGGSVLKKYMDIQLAQGGGITYDQIKPAFTNFQGADVYGILSTRVLKKVNTVPFGEATVDSIVNGVFTKNLNIVGLTTD